jgi:hypothetical protein
MITLPNLARLGRLFDARLRMSMGLRLNDGAFILSCIHGWVGGYWPYG